MPRGPTEGPVVVFGASGRLGSLVVQEAIRRGEKVRAFKRGAKAIGRQHERHQVVEGSLDDLSQVRAAIAGASAVIVVLGPRSESQVPFTARATANILRAMAEAGVTRIVCVTGAMVGEGYPNRGGFYRRMRAKHAKRAPDLARDRDEQERILKESPLDWTVVKPPRLTDGERRGSVRTGPDLPIGMTAKVSRADLASFLLDEAANREFVRRCVFIAY